MTMPKIFKNHFLLTSVIFAGLFLVIFFLLVIPTIRQINKINKDVFEERKRLENLYASGQLQKKVIGRYNQAKEKAGFLEEIFLREGQELEYITKIENAAAAADVSVKINLGESEAEGNPDLSKLRFSFEGKGGWENLLQWLQKIEATPQYTNISEITAVASAERNSTSTAASLKINAETYWLKL